MIDYVMLADACKRPLVYLVPTRGRPQNARALIEAWSATATEQAALVFAVDEDDPARDEYVALGWPFLVVGRRRRVGGTLNALAPLVAAAGAEAIGFMGDDHRPRTGGWDVALLEALRASGPGVAYANDLFQGGRLPTAVAISAPVVRALGFFVPPGMVHLYLDDFWWRLGTELHALTYLPDVIVEHLHPAAGKADVDDGYLACNAPEQFAADYDRWQRYLGEHWRDDLARLRRELAAVSR